MSVTPHWGVGWGRIALVTGSAQMSAVPGGRGAGQVIKSKPDNTERSCKPMGQGASGALSGRLGQCVTAPHGALLHRLNYWCRGFAVLRPAVLLRVPEGFWGVMTMIYACPNRLPSHKI